MVDPTSSIDTQICGMNQTASMQIFFDLKIKGIGIELATIPSPQPEKLHRRHFARIEMQIHLMTIARHLRLRYIASIPIELDAGVNLRSKCDFIMHPEAKLVGTSDRA